VRGGEIRDMFGSVLAQRTRVVVTRPGRVVFGRGSPVWDVFQSPTTSRLKAAGMRLWGASVDEVDVE
jgi:hypothetical protein